jgi:hypothetical protein
MTPLGPQHAVIGALLALGGACATTPPVETPKPPPENAQAYYPLQEGWRWAYEVEKNGEHILAIYAVANVVQDTVILETGSERLLYAILPDGIARKEGLTVGDFILRTPIRLGAMWPVASGHATVTAVGRTITVAAGTFPNCAVIEEARTSPERVLRTTYAAGVGPIAVEYQVHDAGTGRFETPLRATLRGVTRPGDDPLR